MAKTKQNHWLEFAGKLITPLTIIILVLSFKSTVEERLSNASEVSVLGSSFKFHSQDFDGQLSALEVYYVIYASKLNDSFLQKDAIGADELAAIYLLSSKGILNLEESNLEGVEGRLLGLELTAKGVSIINQLGLG
ncbi:MAG: hypothetical protein Roseis2KO_30430 [Roseivirga sp.]